MSEFWAATLALGLAGAIGVAVLAATLGDETLNLIPVKGAIRKRIVLAIQPLILLLIFAAAGTATADRAGTRSIIAEWAAGRHIESASAGIGLAALLGVTLGFGLFLLDRVTRPLWSPSGGGPDLARDWSPRALAAGLVYGGVTEEIMMRWGIMNLVLWLLVTIADAPSGDPSAAIAAIAIAAAALLFAAGHLPAAFAGGHRGRRFIARTLGLNVLAGLVFGWLFWRWSLEAAMVAHAGFHVGGAILALGLRARRVG